MQSKIPIQHSHGVELIDTPIEFLKKAKILDPDALNKLSWDRFIRLDRVSRQVEHAASAKKTILDVGGFDGSIKLFLQNFDIDVLDPATTGASIMDERVKELSYESVIAIDVLEHIEPSKRDAALQKIATISNSYVFLNYPQVESLEAQKIVFQLTGNQFVEEHIKWPLPKTDEVIKKMSKLGFDCRSVAYGNTGLWASAMVVSHSAPEKSADLNSYLINNHIDEAASKALYHLVICKKNLREKKNGKTKE